MRRAVLGLAVVAAACSGAIGPAPSAGPATPAEVEAEVRAAVEQYRQAYEVRSIDALLPLYTTTDDLVVARQGRSVRGPATLRQQLEELFGRVTQMRVRITQVHVVPLGGNGALATMTLARRYGDGTTTIEERGVLMLVFRRAGDGWTIVGEHYSFTLPAAR